MKIYFELLTYWILASAGILLIFWISFQLEQLYQRRQDRVRKLRSAANLERLTAITPDDLITLIEASERVHAEELHHEDQP